MRFHLLKPIHGWRAFFGEVAIIVLGVLIALAAQQFVEQRSWAGQVREARVSMDEQLLDSKYAALERIRFAKCIKSQLNRLDVLIELDELPLLPSLRGAPFRAWPTSTWDAATASGAVAHLDPKIRNIYAQAFYFTSLVGPLNQSEFSDRAELATMRNHRRLDPVSRDRLARAISSARANNFMLEMGSRQWLEMVKPLNLELTAEDRKQLESPQVCPMPEDPWQEAWGPKPGSN